MTKTTASRRITPQEWVQDYFSPAVAVLASEDAEAVCAKNNLTLTELLQPFSKLLSDVTVKDPEGVNHGISGLCINFNDFFKDPARIVNNRLVSDLLANCSDEDGSSMTTRVFDGIAGERARWSLEAPAFTPWFDIWMRCYMHSVPAADHEFSRHHVGCVLAVSSACTDVVAELRRLGDRQYRHQHDKPGSHPQFSSSPGSVLHFYLLIHDAYDGGQESAAQDSLNKMKAAFGANACHLLQVNSKNASSTPSSDHKSNSNPPSSSGNISDHWLGHSHRFCNVDARRQGLGANVITTTESSVAAAISTSKTNDGEKKQKGSDDVEHPLMAVNNVPESPPPPEFLAKKQLSPVTPANIAGHLTPNDIDRIRIFVREFCIRGLIPHVERQMRLMTEIVTNRKSRSFLSGAKRWFGQNKGGAAIAAGTSVVYSKEAPELHMRKLGDFYFMMRMHKHAYNCYHSCKKDFQSDEAWNYYSGATEMCALANFLQGADSAKKYPAHYMEDSIAKYLQVCQMPEFAVRATLMNSLCLKYLGQFYDAASCLVRMTSESKDLRSALLFEQASYCYLLSTPALVRKYAFHVILAAYRYSKAGQKRHSIRTYRQGFQVYEGHGWTLADDHILYTLGHQALLMKDHSTAASLFNDLLLSNSSSSLALQMCQLREFFILHHMREKEDKKAALITVPHFDAQRCVLDLTGEKEKEYSMKVPTANWHALERVIAERVSGEELMFLSRSCQGVLDDTTNNSLVPQGVVGEQIRWLIPLENRFHAPLVLKKVKLLWRFKKKGVGQEEGETSVLNEPEEAIAESHCPSEPVTLQSKGCTSATVLRLGLTLKQPGELEVHGIEYSLKAQFSQSEATDYTIRGRQDLKVTGPRLQATKDHKTSVTYRLDHRLKVQVGEELPRLNLDLGTMPETLFQGEVRCLEVTLVNEGPVPLTKLHLIHDAPGILSLGSRQQTAQVSNPSSLFDFPVISDPLLRQTLVDGESQDTPLDFVPVHLANGTLDPGKVEKIALWIRGPSKLGMNEVRLFFYYEKKRRKDKKRHANDNDDNEGDSVPRGRGGLPRAQYRIVNRTFKFKVLPSITASASVGSCPEAFAQRNNESIVAHVSNISKRDQSGGAENKALEKIFITQISLISHTRRLCLLETSNESAIVSRGESFALSLQSSVGEVEIDTSSKQPHEKALSGRQQQLLVFSSSYCRNAKAFAVHSSPYVDFLKSEFSFSQKDPQQSAVPYAPSLDAGDILSIFWKGSGNNPVVGQLVVPIKKMRSTGGDNAIPRHNRTEGNDRKRNSACHVSVSVSPCIRHDFLAGATCVVPCSVSVRNTSATQEFVVSAHLASSDEKGNVDRDADSDGDCCTIVGAVNSQLRLAPKATRCLSLGIVITAPGLYQCKDLRLKVSRKGEDSSSTFVPVKINFFALQQ